MGDNRHLDYQDFRHIIDDLSVYRPGTSNDQALWEARSIKVRGVRVEERVYPPGGDFSSITVCSVVAYPQDHPFFLDTDSRPEPPSFSLLEKLGLPIIIEEINVSRNFNNYEGHYDPSSSSWQRQYTELGNKRSLLIWNAQGFITGFDAKFVRSDGKDLSSNHIMAFWFIQIEINPVVNRMFTPFFEAVEDVLKRATRANFEQYWEEFKIKHLVDESESSPYHDIEEGSAW